MKSELTEQHYDGSTHTGDHYRCVGSVRGWCGHRHTSVREAVRCLQRDQRGCKSQGGYSDRCVYLYAGDNRQCCAEIEHLV